MRFETTASLVQMLIGAAIALAAATTGIWLRVPGVSTFLICFFFVTQAIFVSHLWTIATDYFDTVSSKRIVPLLTMGASIGGVVGGLIAVVMTGIAGAPSLIAGWAIFLFGAAAMIRIGRSGLRKWGPIELEEGRRDLRREHPRCTPLRPRLEARNCAAGFGPSE